VSTARKHHYVPRCYLRGFSRGGSKNSKLFAVDIARRATYWPTVENVCAVRDFNRIEVAGLRPDELESSLSKFETGLTRALETITADPSARDADAWMYVLNLMSLIAVRNPHTRSQMEGFQADLIRMIAKMTVSTPEHWNSTVRDMLRDGSIDEPPKPSYEEMKKFVQEGQYTIGFPHGYHVATEFAVQDTVLRTLGDRKWLLLQVDPSEGEFISSDLPLCLMPTSGEPASLMRPIGHGMTGTTVLFPINSYLLAMGRFEGEEGFARAGRDDVAKFNLAVALYCNTTIFARTDRFLVADRSGDGFTTGAGILARISPSPRQKPRRPT
jgi:Protein of unknown function (DUF4238)